VAIGKELKGVLLLVGACGLLLFFYKYIYVAVKLGRWDLLSMRLGREDIVSLVLFQSEPFVTQAILNEVVRSGFSVGPAHLADSVYLLVPFADMLGAQPASFNSLFQKTLFSGHVGGGLANNIWAQMLAAGGAMLLAAFTVFHHILLAVGSVLLRHVEPLVRSLVVWLGVYGAFYLHRNDLIYHLNLERRVLMTWGLAVLLGMASASSYRAIAAAGGLSAS
jgi:hypothetical protein